MKFATNTFTVLFKYILLILIVYQIVIYYSYPGLSFKIINPGLSGFNFLVCLNIN